MPETEKIIYLTFDDGPHPEITPFVLQELAKYNARATFFCIGNNVEDNKTVYERILEEGHAVGNHSFDHLDGWKTSKEEYVSNVLKAGKIIKSGLFRPPYGRITRQQRKALTGLKNPFKIIMWSVLSGDFDLTVSPEQCGSNILKYAKSGAIIVFHDSEKAFERMQYALPVVLKHFADKGYQFKEIDL
jgi:peptidoglycan/xylan/chitin deacetylase (PgdA/CDA1 family)